MASTYTTSLNLELQASGENSGTWGTKTNTNISLLETAICGGSSSSLAITATSQSLTASDGSADQSRRAVLKLTGTLTGNTTLSSEAVEKIYWIDNQATMSTYTLTFKPAGGSGVSLASGRKHLIFQDGSTAFDPLADYGPINSSALVSGGNMTIGSGTDGTDYTLTFDGHAGDGVITWMEDEDQFKFSDDVMIVDNEKLILGTDSNITITYDESTNDALEIAANVEGAALPIVLKADQGDDAGDEWKINVADGGTITFGNDANSAGTYVTHVTMTPNSTVASSTVTFAGNVSVANTLIPDSVGGADIGSTSAEWGDVYIADDKKIKFGNAQDVTIEYDEDGTDTLLISGDATFADDKKLYFGTGKDAYIEYDEDGTDTWDFSPPAGGMKILDDKKLVFGTGSDVTLEYDEDGTDTLLISGDSTIIDDKKLYFGTGKDAYIEYDEDGNDTWVFSPPTGGLQILDDKKLVFGDGSDISIEYDEDGEDRLRIEGAPVVVSGGEGEAGDLHLYADQGDDAGDEWKISCADGGTLTLGNDLNSAGTYVTHFTITPNATVASSTVTLGGSLNITTVAAAGSDTDKFLVLDGSGNVDYRTGTQVLSDIGGGTGSVALTGSTDNTIATVTGSNAIAGEANFTFDATDALIAGAGKLQLRDSALFINSSTDGQLDIDADTELEITAPTVDIDASSGVDISTDLTICDDLLFGSSGAVINFNSGDVTLTHGSNLLTLDGGALDLDGEKLILDANANTSITADTDDQIDIEIAGADDFQFTANTFTILSGSTIAIAAGGAITNAGSMAPDISSTGKAMVLGF